MTRARWLAVAVLIIAVIFAYQGGTFSQRNYTTLRHDEVTKRQRVAELTREVDSLKRYRDSLVISPALQERVARERWGWARPGEMAFGVRVDSAPRR